MAFDPEELRRKRLAREQRRKRQRQQLIVRLVIAAVVLIAVGIAIFLIARPQAAPEQPPVSAPSDPIDPSIPDAPEEEDTVIHFVTTGDLNVSDMLVSAGGASFDYTNVFLDVAPLFADADLSAINLEGNLCGSPYGTSTGSAPQSLATALSRAGVDIIQLANSYSINRGSSGLSATIDSVRSAGMEPVGVFKDEADFRQRRGYSLFMVKDIKIAVVAFTKGVGGMTMLPGSENCVNLLYQDYDSTYQRVDTQRISAIMDAVNEENPDLIITLVHWGSEFNDNISGSQYTICNLLKQKGADAIIGTHSHYIEKMELDEATGTFVAYGLGDFVYSPNAATGNYTAGSQYGVVLDLEITKSQGGETKITDFSYTPTYCLQQDDSPVRVVRIKEAMRAYESGHMSSITKAVYDDMAYSLWRIDARIAGE